MYVIVCITILQLLAPTAIRAQSTVEHSSKTDAPFGVMLSKHHLPDISSGPFHAHNSYQWCGTLADPRRMTKGEMQSSDLLAQATIPLTGLHGAHRLPCL